MKDKKIPAYPDKIPSIDKSIPQHPDSKIKSSPHKSSISCIPIPAINLSSNLTELMKPENIDKENQLRLNENYNSLNHHKQKHESSQSVHNLKSNSSSGDVNVICRFRPLNEKELEISTSQCVEFPTEKSCKINSEAENNKYSFNFDHVFNPDSKQIDVFESGAKPIVEGVLQGFNGTIFTYGQTSSGKTHTMQGIIGDKELEGIIPRVINQIFNSIETCNESVEYIVKVSMMEIYMERIKDLFNTNNENLNVREDKLKGIYIDNLTEEYVYTEEEVMEKMIEGSENRKVSCTNMNDKSSRSHSIVILTIQQNNTEDLSVKTGKLYLVDLAGSEKISKTGATGMTLEEAKTINKSLTTLGMVINALTDGKSNHIPYRESKLTRVLSESLGGNAKTCLIITCSPSTYNEAESLSTLRFGLRAKKIKNKAKVNKQVTLTELKKEIDRLESELLIYKKRVDSLEDFIKSQKINLPIELMTGKFVIDEENEIIISGTKLDFDDIQRSGSIEFNSNSSNDKITNDKNDVIIQRKSSTKSVSSAQSSPERKKLATPDKLSSMIEVLNNQLAKEREMFKLQDKKLGESRAQYCEMIMLNADLEENIEYVNSQLTNNQDSMNLLTEQLGKKDLIIKELENSMKKLEESLEQVKKELETKHRHRKSRLSELHQSNSYLPSLSNASNNTFNKEDIGNIGTPGINNLQRNSNLSLSPDKLHQTNPEKLKGISIANPNFGTNNFNTNNFNTNIITNNNFHSNNFNSNILNSSVNADFTLLNSSNNYNSKNSFSSNNYNTNLSGLAHINNPNTSGQVLGTQSSTKRLKKNKSINQSNNQSHSGHHSGNQQDNKIDFLSNFQTLTKKNLHNKSNDMGVEQIKTEGNDNNNTHNSDNVRQNTYSINHSVLNDRSIDEDKSEDLSYMGHSDNARSERDSNFDENSMDSLDVMKERYEEEQKMLLYTIEEKNETLSKIETELESYKSKYNLIKQKLELEENSFLQKIQEEHYKQANKIDALNLNIQEVIKERNNLNLKNQMMETNLNRLNLRLTGTETENVGLRTQLMSTNEKLNKIQLQLKTKRVVKVIKAGKSISSIPYNA